MGMLMSARVARETGLFLREGHFSSEIHRRLM
jgi:hypothetical protein